MKIFARDPGKKKIVIVGEGIGDTLYKKVIRDVHFMRDENGYGIQLSAFPEIKLRFKYIVIIEDTGWHFKTKVEDWLKYGHDWNYKHGIQKFLSMEHFEVIKAPPDFKPLQVSDKKEKQTELF